MKSQAPTLAAGVALALTIPAFAANTCDALYQAGIKSIQTPHHVYSTTTSHAGKAQSGEAIYAGGVEYLKLNGQWRRSPMTPKDMVELAEEKLKTHPDTCTLVAEQTVDGQAVVAYKAHNNEMGTDQLVRLPEGHALLDQPFGQVGGGRAGCVRGPSHGLGIERRRGDEPGHGG